MNMKRRFSSFIKDAKRFEFSSLTGGTAAPRQVLPEIELDNSISMHVEGARVVINGEVDFIGGAHSFVPSPVAACFIFRPRS